MKTPSLAALLVLFVCSIVTDIQAQTNSPPTISGIANQTGVLDAPIGPLAFTVSDVETPADQLTVTFTTSNNGIIPTNQVVLSGSGSNRFITILSGTNSPGSANITLSCTDTLGSTSSMTFSATINQFTNIASKFPISIDLGGVAWADCDNDGLLDLVVTGTINLGFLSYGAGAITRIYHNDGGSFTNFISLPGLYHSAVAWCDYDRDGFIDLAVCGLDTNDVAVTRIYHNNRNGTFSDIAAGLLGLYGGSIAWGDFNNDGAPDLLVTGGGPGPLAKLYRNNGDGTFSDIDAAIPGPTGGTASWGDFNNDGKLDLLLVGITNVSNFRTLAGVFLGNGDGTFTNTWSLPAAATFAAVESGAIGDFDNDGLLDVVIGLAGTVAYKNNGNGSFTSNAVINSNAKFVACGDLNCDGLVDIVAGDSGSTRIFANNGNTTFTSQPQLFPGLTNGAVALGDFNRDTKLDLAFTRGVPRTIFGRNEVNSSNPPPASPSIIGATNLGPNAVRINWSSSLDARSRSNSVSYNIRVGTQPGGIDVVSPMADPATGLRRIPALGNAGVTNWTMLQNLPSGAYYWSVQAIDNSFAGSQFSPESTFVVTNSLPTITRITNRSIPVATLYSVPFSIGDADDDLTNLTLTARSSNTNVIPSTNVSLTVPDPNSPSNYIINIMAVTNGASVISLTVTDPHGAYASRIFTITAAAFTLASSNFIPVHSASAAWADFDNDGKLDVLITGSTNVSAINPRTILYRNLGAGNFSPVVTSLPNVALGSVAWADFNNDGLQDLVITGTTNGTWDGAVSRIYKNTGTGFLDIGAPLPKVYLSAVAWGDYDNDGKPDLIIAGLTNSFTVSAITRIYRNNGDGTFSNTFSFQGVSQGAVAFADFDGDGYLDFVIAGLTNGFGPVTRVYRNNAGKSFSPMFTLPPVYNCSIVTGDFDNDGRPDILITGNNLSLPSTRVFRNNGDGTFADIGVGLPPCITGSAGWGDFNNDGLLDVFICGSTNSTRFFGITRAYLNSGSAILSQRFTNFISYSGFFQTNYYYSAATVVDFDNDGALDVLCLGGNNQAISGSYPAAFLFRNNAFSTNTLPTAPTNLSFARSNTTVNLAWNKSTDLETTNSDGLRYQLRIGRTPGGIEIKSPQSDLATGFRRVPQAVDAFTNQWPINGLAPGTYYWSVQAVDTAFAGSPFSTESTFTVLQPPTPLPDAIATSTNTPIIFPASNLASNDIDLYSLPLTVVSTDSNSIYGGTISLSGGMVTYTPPTNFLGNDVFFYSVSDGQSASATSSVTATVGSGGMVRLRRVSGPAVENGDFVMRLAGVPGAAYTIETTASLQVPWSKLCNVTAPSSDAGFGIGVFEIRDGINTNSARFYRTLFPAY
jgi:hypothetical protein